MRTAILATLILSACTAVVPSTITKLNAISPLHADPADFAIALTLLPGIGIRPGSARLTLTVVRDDIDAQRSGVFVLERVTNDSAIYRIATGDQAALRAIQQTGLAWQAENEAATSGALGINLSPCMIGTGPAPGARVSVGIRVAKEGSFLPLIRNGPLTAVTTPEVLRDMGAC